jgi:hypothetical protein
VSSYFRGRRCLLPCCCTSGASCGYAMATRFCTCNVELVTVNDGDG